MPKWISAISHALNDGLTVGVVHIPHTVALCSVLSLIIISVLLPLFIAIKYFGAFKSKGKRIVFVGNNKDNVWVSKEMMDEHLKGFGRPSYNPASGQCEGKTSLSPDSKTKINLS